MSAPHNPADGLDWGTLAEQFGLLEYGLETLEERLEAALGLPQVEASEQLKSILDFGFGGNLEYLAKVVARLDAKLSDAFELFGPKTQSDGGSIGWIAFKVIAGGGGTPPPKTDE
jgi:hypothetical protein